MYEFDVVSVSTYEAASLAAKLTEKSADGWEVVAIVPAGSDITAYLKKTAPDAAAPEATSSEPAGWGTAPAAAGAAAATTWGSNSGDAASSTTWGSSTP